MVEMIGRLDESLDEGQHHGTKQARLSPASIVSRYRWPDRPPGMPTCAPAALLLDSVFQVRTIVILVLITG
jgi:hypothetical protein